jgi:hypothetical protein
VTAITVRLVPGAYLWGSFNSYRRSPLMDTSRIPRRYKELSSEDQRTFRRWARVDAAISVILVAGLIAMAVAAAALRPEYDSTVGRGKTNPGIVASDQNRK